MVTAKKTLHNAILNLPTRNTKAHENQVILSFAGSDTFPGLQKFIIEQSKTKVYAFLHIAAHGLATTGCAGVGNVVFHDCKLHILWRW